LWFRRKPRDRPTNAEARAVPSGSFGTWLRLAWSAPRCRLWSDRNGEARVGAGVDRRWQRDVYGLTGAERQACAGRRAGFVSGGDRAGKGRAAAREGAAGVRPEAHRERSAPTCRAVLLAIERCE